MIDSKARTILFDAYWSAKGWNSPRKEPSPDDLAYAKAAGVMFDPEVLTHDEAIDRIIAARSAVDLTAVANSFVASLGSRQVHCRPPLGSFLTVAGVSPHRFVGHPSCAACGHFLEWEHDFSSVNFARLKWGALPRLFAVDHAFVLERFAVEPTRVPDDSDWRLLDRLLSTANSLLAHAKARDLERAWQPIIRSNRAERDLLIEILVAAGVLAASRQSESDLRAIPLKSNWSEGAALWRGDDGVVRSQAEILFGWRSSRPA